MITPFIHPPQVYFHIRAHRSTSTSNALGPPIHQSIEWLTHPITPLISLSPFQIYSAWETDEVIVFELWRNLAMAMVCVFVITLILLADFKICLMVCQSLSCDSTSEAA